VTMFPYDVNELADGPIRCMFAPIGTALPADLSDIIEQTDPYDPETGWWTSAPPPVRSTHSRNLTTAAYNIQQTTQAVRERVTEVIRTSQVNVAELRPDIVALIEESHRRRHRRGRSGVGATPRSRSATSRTSPSTAWPSSAAAARTRASSPSPAPGPRSAGGMFAFVAYRAQLSADNLQLGFAEGDLANANVTFRLYPEPGQPSGEEHGYWIFEDAGTFAA
jgi:hypothetical protein